MADAIARSDVYLHGPLDSHDSIRLVRLQAARQFQDPIVCELFESSLHDAPSYEILSYVWGGLTSQSTILINGHQSFVVNRNLSDALRYLRQEATDRVLWVDYICVNVNDHRERVHQVAQIRRICQSSERVVGWLNEYPPSQDERSVRGIEVLAAFAKELDQRALSLPTESPGEEWKHDFVEFLERRGLVDHSTPQYQQITRALEYLLGLAWFRRIWIIQEVAYARTGTLLYGKNGQPLSFSMHTFALLPSCLGINPKHPAKALLSLMPGGRGRPRGHQRDILGDLKMIMTNFQDHESSDPRDFVYALVEISADQHARSIFLPPDYNISSEELFRNTLSYLLFSEVLEPAHCTLPGSKDILIEALNDPQGLSHHILAWALKNNHQDTVARLRMLESPEHEQDLVGDSSSETASDDSGLSVFSLGSSISTQVSSVLEAMPSNLLHDAADYLADVLSTSPALKPLYAEAISKMSASKFETGHNTLMKAFFMDLRSGSPENSPQHTALRILRQRAQRQRVTRKIRQHFAGSVSEEGPLPLQGSPSQQDTRKERLEAYFNPPTRPQGGSGKLNRPDDDSGSDSEDSGEEDTGQPSEEPLVSKKSLIGTIETAFVDSPAFSAFEESIHTWTHPPETLKDAVRTGRAEVVERFLKKYLGQSPHKTIEFDWVETLNELGLSRRSIAWLLLLRENEEQLERPVPTPPMLTVLPPLASQTDRMYTANLIRRFSDTRNVLFLRDAMRLYRGIPLMEQLNDIGDGCGIRGRSTRTGPARLDTMLFNWEIPKVFSNQGAPDSGIEQPRLATFLVVTGANSHFEASTCREYLHRQFGQSGRDVFHLVSTVFSHTHFADGKATWTGSYKDRVLSFHHEEHPREYCIESVSPSCLVLTAAEAKFTEGFVSALRWVCAAVRVVPPELQASGVLRSSCRCILEASFRDDSHRVNWFSLEPLRQTDQSEIGQSSCWTQLFKSVVVAWDPFMSLSPGPSGLKLPYNMLVRFACVTSYCLIDEVDDRSFFRLRRKRRRGLVACGFYNALVPMGVDTSTGGIRWHLETSEKPLVDCGGLKSIKQTWLRVLDPRILEGAPCFLGWSERVNILLGTERGHYKFQVSPLEKAKYELKVEGFAVSGEIGLGGWSPIVLNTSGETSVGVNSTRLTFLPPEQYDLAIRDLATRVSVIFDTAAQTAWLVPQLSWILHLCHVWYQTLFPDRGQPSRIPIPFAERSTGMYAARDALLHHGEDEVDGKIQLAHVVSHILLRVHRAKHKSKGTWLRAVDARDLVRPRAPGVYPRKIDLPPEVKPWICLLDEADTIHFCHDLGPVLEKCVTAGAQPQRRRCGCDEVPQDRWFLAGHNTCIHRVLEEFGCPGGLNVVREDVAVIRGATPYWFMESSPFDTCTHNPGADYWGFHDGDRTVIQGFSKLRHEVPANWARHSTIPMEGALVFGLPRPPSPAGQPLKHWLLSKLRRSPPPQQTATQP